MTPKQHQSLSRAGLIVAGGTLRPAPRRRKRLTLAGKLSLVLLSLIVSLGICLLMETTITNNEARLRANQEANR